MICFREQSCNKKIHDFGRTTVRGNHTSGLSPEKKPEHKLRPKI
jgi:hypothetical protein